MKKVYVLFSFLLLSGAIAAQDTKNVGIGTSNPDNSAVLDINSESKGLLIPRLTSNQKEKIQSPAKGLLIFQTDESNSGFFFFNGDKWSPLTNGDANAIATVDANGWALDGNATTTTNKAAATAASFIGTPVNVPINFKIGEVVVGKIPFNNQPLSLGYESALNNTSGGNAVAIGYRALKFNTTGNSNTAVGYGAMLNNVSGSSNIALGVNALLANTTASANAAIGASALANNTTGGSNVGIGSASLVSNTVGSYNVSVGVSSLNKNVSGMYNMAVGFAALFENTIGSNNMAMGTEALRYRGGSRNTAIGTWSGRGTTINSGDGGVFIGYHAGANESESNKLYISNSNTPTPLVYGDFSARFVSIGNVPVDKRETVASGGQYSLIVEKGILSEKLKVALKSTGDWADYVFEPEYKSNMMSLEEVEKFTLENKHLPNVPSATELVEKGLDFNETSKMFMEKIEELTLYLIELNKEVKALKVENSELKSKLNK